MLYFAPLIIALAVIITFAGLKALTDPHEHFSTGPALALLGLGPVLAILGAISFVVGLDRAQGVSEAAQVSRALGHEVAAAQSLDDGTAARAAALAGADYQNAAAERARAEVRTLDQERTAKLWGYGGLALADFFTRGPAGFLCGGFSLLLFLAFGFGFGTGRRGRRPAP